MSIVYLVNDSVWPFIWIFYYPDNWHELPSLFYRKIYLTTATILHVVVRVHAGLFLTYIITKVRNKESNFGGKTVK